MPHTHSSIPTRPAVWASLLLLLSTISAGALSSLRWRADIPDTKPYTATIYHGETITLTAQLHAYNQPLTLPPGTGCTLYYQTNGMHNLWWPIPGTATTNATLSATFTPAHDTGAPAYNFFLAAETPTSRLYRAHGTITMRHAPGHTPNALPLPTPTIDFATVQILNPPWPTLNTITACCDAAIATATNAIPAPDFYPYIRRDTYNLLYPNFGFRVAGTNEIENTTWWTVFDHRGLMPSITTPAARIDAKYYGDGMYLNGILDHNHYAQYGLDAITRENGYHGGTYTLPLGPSSPLATQHDIATATNAHLRNTGAQITADDWSLTIPGIFPLSIERGRIIVGEGTAGLLTVARIDWLLPPMEKHHAANKEYVDDTTATATNALDTTLRAELGGTAPDPWQEATNTAAAVTITATSTRIRWTGAGHPTLTLQGLTEGLPVYLVIQGPTSLTITGAYWVGGGSYVAGMANHYMAWSYNGILLINPITATEVQP